MIMPSNYVLIRHGESEGNVALEASRQGDDSYYTKKFFAVSSSQWRITDTGVLQAQAIGEFIANMNVEFDQFFVSPYVRTRMTAVHLGLNHARWSINRDYRERSRGECDLMTLEEFAQDQPNSAFIRANNILYWTPPGGESTIEVADNRVSNIMNNLQTNYARKNVIAVTHGVTMWAHRLVLEDWTDEQFNAYAADKSMKINNCQALHYRMKNPHIDTELNQYRIITPLKQSDGTWKAVVTTDWRDYSHKTYSNDELWETVKHTPKIEQ